MQCLSAPAEVDEPHSELLLAPFALFSSCVLRSASCVLLLPRTPDRSLRYTPPMTREKAVFFIRNSLGCKCPGEILCTFCRETRDTLAFKEVRFVVRFGSPHSFQEINPFQMPDDRVYFHPIERH